MDESISLKKFGDRVKRCRLKAALSQEELGFSSGLDRTYVSSVERGRRNISLINIHKLALALNVEPSFLLQDNGEINS